MPDNDPPSQGNPAASGTPSADAEQSSVADLQTKIQQLEQLLKDKEKPIIYTRDRKLAQFDPKENVTEWINAAKVAIEGPRFKEDSERATFLFEHFDQQVRTEIRYACGPKASSFDIFQYIQASFNTKDTANELNRKFYTRNQGVKETLEEYMLELMSILNSVTEKSSMSIKQKDQLLKFKFADGACDTSLKRELKRLNDERPTLSSHELRHHAVMFMDVRKDAAVQEVNTSSEGMRDPVQQRLVEQQKQLDELTKMMKSFVSGKETTPAPQSSEKRCKYCRKPGHEISECFKLKRKEEARKDQPTDSSKNDNRPSSGASRWKQE